MILFLKIETKKFLKRFFFLFQFQYKEDCFIKLETY